MSTHSQAVFSTWPDYGTIGASYDNSWGLTLASGQSNIFGLPYQSLAEYYSDGASLYSQTYSAGQTIIDAGASNGYACFYYPQVGAPRLQTVGYFFGVAARSQYRTWLRHSGAASTIWNHSRRNIVPADFLIFQFP